MIDLLQWPAMALSMLAAWLVASQRQEYRAFGFWVFVASNIVWAIWGWHASAYALIVLQAVLFALNLRGLRKNDAV